MRWMAVIVVFWFLPSAARAADLSALVDSVIEAYGGAEAVARLEAFRVDAEVTARMRGKKGTVRRDFEAPDRLRVEIAYPEKTEIRILDGEKGWRGNAQKLQRVEGLPKIAMVYQALRSAVPWVLVHHRKILEDRGTQSWAGSGYRLVGLRFGANLDLTFWVHEANRRVIRVDGVLSAGQARAVFGTEYLDFRRMDGLLFPFAENNYASGHHTGTTRVLFVVFSPADLGPFDPAQMEN